jgi:hypothetical protein
LVANHLAPDSHHHCLEFLGVDTGAHPFSSLRKDMDPNPNFTNIPTDFHRLGNATSPIKIHQKPPIGVTIALAIIGLVIFVVVVLLLIASCSPSHGAAILRVTATPMATHVQTTEVPTVGPATPSTPGTASGGGGVTGSTPLPASATNTPSSGQSTPAPPLSPQTILATNTSRWYYTGAWTVATRAMCESDTCVFSKQSGATASITFTGTHINLLGGKNRNGGIGSVKLTNASGTTVGNAAFDCYAKAGTEATLYTSPALSRGTYTLTITVAGTADAASGNSRVFLDSVVITP